MLTVKVLLENSRISRQFKKRHGLSLAIDRPEGLMLLDVGPDRKFLQNAPSLNTDVSKARTLLLSHHHIDHTGGLDVFCDANPDAAIHLFGDTSIGLYAQALRVLRIPIGLRCRASSRARITEHEKDVQLDAAAHFLRHSRPSRFPLPSLNSNLFMRHGGKLRPDDFRHEGVLVIEDGGELVLFNSCSHNGVINSIELVSERFPGMPIRSYVGGFHFRDPISRRTERLEALRDFAAWFAHNDIRLFTGHCTGEKAIRRLQGLMGDDRVVPIRTGMTVQV